MTAPTTKLPPPPYSTAISDQSGMITTPWNRWIQLLFLRVGGLAAISNPGTNQNLPSIIVHQYALNTNSTVYTSPAGNNTILSQFTVTNNDSIAHKLSANVVPVGGTPSASNLVANGQVIPAKSTVTLPGIAGISIGSGGFISCIADSAGALFVTVTGAQAS